MKKNGLRKLRLSRETLRALADAGLGQAGGAAVAGGNLSIPVCTRVISDCIYCTTPLDGCPDPTVAAA